MVAAHLVDNTPNLDEDIDKAMINICRCGTYPRMRSAIHRAAALARDAMADAKEPAMTLQNRPVLPGLREKQRCRQRRPHACPVPAEGQRRP